MHKQYRQFNELPNEGYDECLLCGNKSYGYAFCKNCYYSMPEDELLNILYEDDLTWYDNEPDNNSSDCIICNNESNGYLFCRDCYYKYKNKELYVKITNCKNFIILDSQYETKHTSKDGHKVKSKTEVLIDNYLYDHNIKHAYEIKLPYGTKKDEYITPDFFLPNYLGIDKHVYIEHWGYDNEDYLRKKEFKLSIYKKLNITLVCTNESDASNIESELNRKLNKRFIIEKKINFDE